MMRSCATHCTSTISSLNRKSMLLRCYYASIAAFGTAAASSASSIPSAAAFVSTPPTSRSVVIAPPTTPFPTNTISPLAVPSSSPLHPNYYQQTRGLFSFRSNFNNNNNNEEKEGNIFQKAAKKVKSLLKIQSPEEKAAAIEKKRLKNEISGGLSEILKDAPLPVRMMGKMISPMLSNMAESFAEQSRQLQDLLDDAESILRRSSEVESLLGSGLQVGMPFSQSSSTSIVNGVKTSNVQASFPVSGSMGIQGVVTMQGSMEYGISYLGLNVNGRTYNIALDGQGSVGGSSGRTEVFAGPSSSSYSSKKKSGSKFKEEDVIDVEFYDKK